MMTGHTLRDGRAGEPGDTLGSVRAAGSTQAHATGIFALKVTVVMHGPSESALSCSGPRGPPSRPLAPGVAFFPCRAWLAMHSAR
jgi:hypothetical protein